MRKYTLVGIDGNAYYVMGYVRRAMKQTNFTKEEIEEYHNRATSGDYTNLLKESIAMIEKCNKRIEVFCEDEEDEEEL